MLEKLKLIFIGFCICLLTAGFFIVSYHPKPKIITRYERIEGQVSGQVSALEGRIISPGTKNTPSRSNLRIDAAIPVKGTIETKSVKIELTGTTFVKYENDILSVNTQFDKNAKVTLYQKPEPQNEIGVLFDGGWSGYLRHDFNTGRIRPWAAITFNGENIDYAVGLGIKF